MPRKKEKSCNCLQKKFGKYFKIGVSPDYILVRQDFPLNRISPSDFSKLYLEMFAKNDEVFCEK